MSRCLGARTAALADGVMPPAETERALAHVAACTRCRTDLLTQREMRMLLRGLGAPQVPGDVVASVSRIPVRPMSAPTPGLVPPPPLVGPPPAGEPVSAPPTRLPSLVSRRPGPIVASVAAVTVSAGLSMLAAAPQAAVSVPRVAPDTASFVADHRDAAGAGAIVSPALRVAEIGVPSGAEQASAANGSFAAAASAASVLAVALDPGSTMASAWTGVPPSRPIGVRAVGAALGGQDASAVVGPAVVGTASPAGADPAAEPSTSPLR